MRLTHYSDYALRELIYLASMEEGKLASIKEIADAYNISKNHLMKITYELSKLGLIKTVRGRRGGICLNKHPREINVGKLIRITEDDFKLVECMEDGASACIISPVCGLKHVLNEALIAYLRVLDKYTLEDLVKDPLSYRQLLVK
ncbi:Rrf2 family transcriptional regulator [Heyndrickxia faecalis]|uniref:Rrf2 family transcriptional regulator n=1 Tax=Heyndrickxia TaxID=2837504 RepID=UPI0005577397|nr:MULTISPECIES: Rrf2 family transcriptional regulator [Heyndrickxia]KGT38518.1 Rrf2 family transcriptional regulator [Heyndrickxia coagulans P38]MBQ4911170.1 Rrf2 family transcriptional regulator [Heyndrickxia faecalis]MEC2224952.1 Rrf2 family transcriptional regulator [Weizmannia sp. CD-2023]MED4321962.1 Rrf2 family transcriptional regulator [Weizmannia sp. CD-2023]